MEVTDDRQDSGKRRRKWGGLHRQGWSKQALVGLASWGMEVCPVGTRGLQSRDIGGSGENFWRDNVGTPRGA